MTPQVCAIMLTADRQQLTDRAVQCFLSQTYKQSHLLIYDTGKKPYTLNHLGSARITVVCDGAEMARPIGELRNSANALAPRGTEILIHFDSDDYSGSYRIQDQVQTLIDSGRDCVGYRSVMFWRNPEAWAYHNINPVYCIGASLCYWRRVWVRQRFRDTLPKPDGGMAEDKEWLRHVDSEGYPALFSARTLKDIHFLESDLAGLVRNDANLVCEIHGGNTMTYKLEASAPTGWRRAPEWDGRLKELMAL